MDEILLTPEEMVDAGLDGARKFADAICVYSYKTGLRQKRGKVPNRELYIREEVCRAQVRNFYLWLMTHWQSAHKLDGAVQLTISEADWAALKAAGEGK